MRQEFVSVGRSIMEAVLLTGSNTKPKAHGEIAAVILMCEAIKNMDIKTKLENTNPKTPANSTKIAEDRLLALEWE